MIVALKYCGITRGWDDQKRSDGTQMRISEFADSLFSMVLDLQQDRPGLIYPDIYVIKDYGISRSEGRGATTRHQYSKVPEYAINWTNRLNLG